MLQWTAAYRYMIVAYISPPPLPPPPPPLPLSSPPTLPSQERCFNPYYAHLSQQLCGIKRAHQVGFPYTHMNSSWYYTLYQVTFQYAFWDKFKSLESLSSANLTNLCHLLSHLIATRALSLAVVRVSYTNEHNTHTHLHTHTPTHTHIHTHPHPHTHSLSLVVREY